MLHSKLWEWDGREWVEVMVEEGNSYSAFWQTGKRLGVGGSGEQEGGDEVEELHFRVVDVFVQLGKLSYIV